MKKKVISIGLLLILLLVLASCTNSQQLQENEELINNNEKKQDRTNIIVVNEYLIGEYDGVQYINYEQLSAKEDSQKYTRNYDLYFMHQKDIKNVSGRIADDSGFILFDSVKDHNNVALTCKWNPRVREIETSMDFNEKHKEVIQKRLAQNNLGNTPVVLKKIMRVDLDGDGVDEEIIEADNSEKLDYNETRAITDEAIESNESIMTFEQIGYYRIFVLLQGLNDITLWEDYEPIYHEDFTFRTNEELGIGDTVSDYIGVPEELIEINNTCQPSERLIYLYSQENEVKLYQPYEIIGIVPGWSQDIVEILDIDNDNNMEIILNYRAYPSSRIWILKLEDNKVTTVLERDYWIS